MSVEYCFISDHQESSQPFIVDCVFQPLQTLVMQLTSDWARQFHLFWSLDTHTVVYKYVHSMQFMVLNSYITKFLSNSLKHVFF